MLRLYDFPDPSCFDFWISSPALLTELSSLDGILTEQSDEDKWNIFFKQKLIESRKECFKNKTLSLLTNCVTILKTQELTTLNHLNCLKLFANLSLEKAARDTFQSTGARKWVESFSDDDKPEIFLEAWKILQNLDRKDDTIQYLDCIYPLIPPWRKEEPVVDVVLVHGIKGGASWTWRQHDSKKTNPVLQQTQRQKLLSDCRSDSDDDEGLLNDSYTWIWPLDWLPRRITKPFRIIAVDYPAGWRHSDKQERSESDLTALSEDLLSKLKAAGVGVGGRPIIWVTHSMGGLIVKTMLKSETCREKEQSSPVDILSSTRAVIFLSVPHFGSPVASWICYLAPLFRPPRFVYDLKAGCPKLADTHEVFKELCNSRSIQVLTLNETKPIPITKNGPNVFFVPPKYGNPEIGKYFEVDASHLDVCKPTGRSDETFKIIEEFIIKIFANLFSS